jgi:hypothetical protein
MIEKSQQWKFHQHPVFAIQMQNATSSSSSPSLLDSKTLLRRRFDEAVPAWISGRPFLLFCDMMHSTIPPRFHDDPESFSIDDAHLHHTA